MSAFWDASAVVPLFVRAQKSKAAFQLIRPQPPVIWWGTLVEVHSALARLKGEGVLSATASDTAKRRLEESVTSWRQIQPSDLLRDLAIKQLNGFALRAGDALQLAAALIWVKERPRSRIFITGDKKLGNAAHSVGFDVWGL